MNPQMTFQRICAISGVICPLLFFGAFIAAGFIPPLAPSASAAEIAAHYQSHANGIRLGAGVMLLSGMFYAAYTALISAQMQRIPGVHQTVINAQLAAGAFACLTFLVPAMFFASSVYRPDRSPDLTLLMNDMSWIFLVMPWPPFMVQNFAFAFAILSDRRSVPAFPRWLGYLNIWAPLIFTPAIMLPFFTSGPFAWNGIFVFWIPATVFVIQFIANTIMLLKAIKAEEAKSNSAPPLDSGDGHQPVAHAS
jgi:hypothetical protein